MGGKGRKRREKNYRAAHGDKNRRLPPPPVSSSLDALPSKLRHLLSFTRQSQPPPQPSMFFNFANYSYGFVCFCQTSSGSCLFFQIKSWFFVILVLDDKYWIFMYFIGGMLCF